MDYIINKPSSFLFLKPDLKSPIADEALFGMACKIIGDKNDFYEIEMFYDYKGFIRKSDVSEGEMPEFIVCAPFADILKTPEFCCEPSLTLPLGSRVCAGEAVNENFMSVVLDGRIFYTHINNIRQYTLTPLQNLRKCLTQTAKKYFGVQYRWGGMTPAGIDCSGLTFMCYYQSGILVHRDAAAEKFVGFKQIPLEEARAGDLLFFPGHIALYLGGGLFIHSAGARGGVDINSMDKNSSIYSEYHFLNLKKVLCYEKIY